MGRAYAALDKTAGDSQTVEPGHLDVEEHQVGLALLDHLDGLKPIRRFSHNFDLRMVFEEERQLLPSQLLVVNDEGGDRHVR